MKEFFLRVRPQFKKSRYLKKAAAGAQSFTSYEKKMLLPSLAIEQKLWQSGYKFVAGIDEVGRGSWAGPLVVAAVILPIDFKIPQGLADSKLIKHKKRVSLAKIIKDKAISWQVVEISPRRIDKIKMAKATHEAFRRVAKSLSIKPDFCLIDAFYIKHFAKNRQQAVKNGDKICASIAAASIIAKVYRDNLMRRVHFKYPIYGFAKHKGYGTKFHQDAIRKFGFCQIHRMSYDLNYLVA